MNLRKAKQDSLRFIGYLFLAHSVTVLCKSLKIKKNNFASIKRLNENKKNYILAFWHGTMLVPWYLHGRSDFVALTSKSKDGNLLAKILRHWDYEVIRGSSSFGGEVALGIMVDYAKNKYSIAITPDGPRGPEKKLKAGAVIAAKKSKVPLILVGVGYRKKINLSNWDKFEIPYLFSRVNVVYSEPIYIDSNLSYDETSKMIIYCENKLNELQAEAMEF